MRSASAGLMAPVRWRSSWLKLRPATLAHSPSLRAMCVPVVRQLKRGAVVAVRPTTASGAGGAAAQAASNPVAKVPSNSAFNIECLLTCLPGVGFDRGRLSEFAILAPAAFTVMQSRVAATVAEGDVLWTRQLAGARAPFAC